MSNDRKVATDALETLGTLIDETAQRDAIHLAVIPMVAATRLTPGEHVGRMRDGTASPVLEDLQGIVDPFLTTPVEAGQRFWMVIYPRQITSLRHVWSHPAFADETVPAASTPNVEVSEQWLRDFCARVDCPGYDAVMEVLRGNTRVPSFQGHDWYGARYDEDGLIFYGRDAHAEIPPEFWVHAETVLGKRLPHRPEYFQCSC